LFERGQALALRRGLILVDTKYEIGRLNGEFVVSDEVHTPDSSRYWFADSYEPLFRAGKEQRKLDKEYVREWLAAQGFRGDGEPPKLPDDVRVEAAKRYIEAYEIITGLEFKVTPAPVEARIRRVLKAR
jgi:phosphoribosylaminoimidazole-succinocarboxamide synthase